MNSERMLVLALSSSFTSTIHQQCILFSGAQSLCKMEVSTLLIRSNGENNAEHRVEDMERVHNV